MARRIDVELTSARDDGTWTWRAAGARQPKGVVDAGLLYDGAKVGDVVRAEAEFDVDGITVISVTPPKEKKRAGAERLEITGSGAADQPGVTTSLVGKGDRDRRDDGRRRERRPDRVGVGARPDRGDRPGRGPRGEGPDRPRRERDDRPRRERAEPRPAPPPRPKPKRLQPGRTHRDALLAELSPEERPVAEQVLRGGIPAVRKAVEDQNAKLRAEGQSEVKADALVAMAEALLPRARQADWLDRAEAALHDLDTIALRDLRAVVVGADAVARDDTLRTLAGTLREALDRRLAEEKQTWLDEITRALDDGRAVRALRISARPPDVGVALPAELTTRLAEAATAALTPDATPDRWAAVVDALAWSPVRTAVKPEAGPPEPDEALLAAVRKLATRLPHIAGLLGVPVPSTGARPPRRGPGKAKGAERRPPKPGRPDGQTPRTPGGPKAAATGETAVESTPTTVGEPAAVEGETPATPAEPETAAATAQIPVDGEAPPSPGEPATAETTVDVEPPATTDEPTVADTTAADETPAAPREPEAAAPTETTVGAETSATSGEPEAALAPAAAETTVAAEAPTAAQAAVGSETPATPGESAAAETPTTPREPEATIAAAPTETTGESETPATPGEPEVAAAPTPAETAVEGETPAAPGEPEAAVAGEPAPPSGDGPA